MRTAFSVQDDVQVLPVAQYVLDNHVGALYCCLLTLDLAAALYLLDDHAGALHSCLLALDLIEHRLVTGRCRLVSHFRKQFPVEHPKMVQRRPHSGWAIGCLPLRQRAASSRHSTETMAPVFALVVWWTFDDQRRARIRAVYLPTVGLIVSLSHSPLQQQPLPQVSRLVPLPHLVSSVWRE
jgi:hypothetical protein